MHDQVKSPERVGTFTRKNGARISRSGSQQYIDVDFGKYLDFSLTNIKYSLSEDMTKHHRFPQSHGGTDNDGITYVPFNQHASFHWLFRDRNNKPYGSVERFARHLRLLQPALARAICYPDGVIKTYSEFAEYIVENIFPKGNRNFLASRYLTHRDGTIVTKEYCAKRVTLLYYFATTLFGNGQNKFATLKEAAKILEDKWMPKGFMLIVEKQSNKCECNRSITGTINPNPPKDIDTIVRTIGGMSSYQLGELGASFMQKIGLTAAG